MNNTLFTLNPLPVSCPSVWGCLCCVVSAQWCQSEEDLHRLHGHQRPAFPVVLRRPQKSWVCKPGLTGQPAGEPSHSPTASWELWPLHLTRYLSCDRSDHFCFPASSFLQFFYLLMWIFMWPFSVSAETDLLQKLSARQILQRLLGPGLQVPTHLELCGSRLWDGAFITLGLGRGLGLVRV